MKEKQILTEVSSPYFELENDKSDKLIYVLHGYGQLAKFFIQKFKPLQELGFKIVAPEGLHRFYLEGTNGRVGASWMTKENRELDIHNYISMLNNLHTKLKKEKEWKAIHVLGFSQGVATAFRWIADEKIKPSHFLMCSGMIPSDVHLQGENSIFKAIKSTYFSGTNDIYKTEEAVLAFQQKLKESNLDITMVEFDGGHEVNLEAVLKVLQPM